MPVPVVIAVISQRADIGGLLPLLFVIYVIYSIVSQIAKAARQQQAARNASQAAPAAPADAPPGQTYEDRLRALQAERRAAATALQAATQAQRARTVPASVAAVPAMAPARVTSPVTASLAPPARLTTPDPFAAPLAMMSDSTSGPDLTALLTSLPPAAQAIVAGVVIGPCAAHRGGGHIPEDW